MKNQLIYLTLVALVAVEVAAGYQVRVANTTNEMQFSKQENFSDNEIDSDQDRFQLAEPYKSMIQTTARFALAHTRIPTMVNMETVMRILGEVAYQLAKPIVLFKVLKFLGVLIATVSAASFAFPSSYVFIDAVYRDPVNALNLDRYFSNGLSERSVLSIIGTKTDDALSRVGLQDNSCRERSLCYVGEIFRCSFPTTSQSIAKMASDNLSDTGIKDNVYYRAFTSGFVDRNCSSVGSSYNSREQSNCLANIVSSLIK